MAAFQKREVALRQSIIETRTADNIRRVAKDPFIKNVTYDPEKGEISGSLRPPRTWRRRIANCADWLVNHHLLPVWAWRWLGKRLGYKL